MERIYRIILIGLFIRLLMMPFTMHPDLAFLYYFPSLMKTAGVWDIYSYLKTNYFQSIAQLGWFYYPPLTYYFFGLYTFIISGLSHSFLPWMRAVGMLIDGGGLIQHYLTLPGTDQIYRDLFLMKIPYLFFDGLVIWLLTKFINDEKKLIAGLKMWCFSPIIIYSAFMFGQFDVIPTALVMLSLYLIKLKRVEWAVFILGLAAALKNFPLLFCLPMILVAEENNWQRIKLLVIFALPYLVFLLPSLLNSGGYALQVFLPQVMINKQLGEQNMLSYGLNMLFILLYFYLIYKSFKSSVSRNPYLFLVDVYLIVILLYFISSFPSIHYIVWIVPLAILKAVDDKKMFWTFILLQLTIFIALIAYRPMLFGLFAPVQPLYFPALPALVEFTKGLFKYSYLQFLAIKVFILTAIIWAGELIWSVIND